MFSGSYVAIVTPFKNGAVDYERLRELVEFQIENGTSGIVPCGTTGESATLTHEEHKMVNKTVIEQVAGRVQVIAGAGSNNTAEAIELAKDAEQAGADAILCITPYYNKPTQEGLFQHFKEVNDHINIPIVLYNVPGRTGSNMLPATVQRLAKLKNIVAIKEASGMLDQVTEIITNTNLDVLSGDDALTLPIMALGGKGIVSVAANIVPDMVANLCRAALNGDFAAAREINSKLFFISKAMFIETNPIPVKTALSLMNKISLEFRLPLVQMQTENKTKLQNILKQYSVI